MQKHVRIPLKIVNKTIVIDESHTREPENCAFTSTTMESIAVVENNVVDIAPVEETIVCTAATGDSSPSMQQQQSIQIDRTAFEKPGASPPSPPQQQQWITLNVGGRHFTTTLGTLCHKEPGSMLARMFATVDSDADADAAERPGSSIRPSDRDATGAYLIDRSGRYFEPILDYLRHGQLVHDDGCSRSGILAEARFYGIESLVAPLEQAIAAEAAAAAAAVSQTAPLTRRDVIAAIVATSHRSELRFQGVDLSGADLSKLDLQNINFKFAGLSGANLASANLNNCCLERADLSHANMEGAQLLSVRGSCANMEAANLRGCNFEDPHGNRTCLEGVNLKGACLENSNMACVNLRVANLKNANLRNCNLRAAVLAGADLERCTLSGSDLHEANLRGANFKDAELELMLTPLHMSQAVR